MSDTVLQQDPVPGAPMADDPEKESVIETIKGFVYWGFLGLGITVPVLAGLYGSMFR